MNRESNASGGQGGSGDLAMVVLLVDSELKVLPGSGLGRLHSERDLVGEDLDRLDPRLGELARELRSGESRDVEFDLDGRHHVGMMSALAADHGVRYEVIAADVTPIAAREEAVARREQELQLLVDTALDPVISCDESSRIIAWNSSATSLFGWTPEEAIGRTLSETIVPDDLRGAHAAGMKRHLETGEGPALGARIEIEAVDRAGRRFPIELSVNPIVMPDRRGFSAFIRDISDRVAGQARLVGSESRLRSALDAMQAGAWEYSLDETGGVVSSIVDDRVRDLFGDDAELLPTCRTNIHPDDRAAVSTAWNAAVEMRNPRYDVEYRTLGPEDRIFWRREVGVLIPKEHEDVDHEGRPVELARMLGVVQDVTHEKELEETLSSARRLEAVGQVASGFAHDLNNVLSAISGHATLAALAPDLPEKSVRSMEVIKDAVARGRALTQNMLSLGRPGPTQRDRIDLAVVIEDTLKLAVPVLGSSIRVERDLPRDLGWIESDANQWQQAILNLVINAKDAMEGHGLLEVALRCDSGASGSKRLVVEIRDTGKGMSPETLEMATRPFFTTKGKKGTGLGLAMVHRLVEAEMGSIEIDSKVGVGTTIRLAVPARSDDAGATSSGADARSRRVFLVEDHPLLRPMLAESLTNGGFEVTAVSDGSQAFQEILEVDPAVLVVDINLPGRRGDDLASSVRTELGRELPVLFITGNNDFDPPRWPHTDFLRKPFELEDLNRKVRGLAP